MFVLSGLFHVICAELVEPGKGKSPYFFVKDSMFSLKKTESRPPTDIMGAIRPKSKGFLLTLVGFRADLLFSEATADFTMSPVEGIGLYFCLLPRIARPS